MSDELNLDVSPEHARALHRVVRAMHDGNCPKCGYLGPSNIFWHDDRHECPVCHFVITEVEARAAMMAFRPHMTANLAVFEEWRSTNRGSIANDVREYDLLFGPKPIRRGGCS